MNSTDLSLPVNASVYKDNEETIKQFIVDMLGSAADVLPGDP